LREATGGLVSRSEGFIISLSTQSDAPPAGVFKAKLDYFRDVRDGKIEDPKSLGVLYEFPKAMVDAEAYLDPANFYVTNPNIGRSVSAEWLEDELRKELAKGPETRNTFFAKHLNVEIGMNMRANRWSGADFWEARAISLTLDQLIERSEVIVVGIDGGGLDDLFGLTVVGREPAVVSLEVEGEDGLQAIQPMKRWLSWSHAWCHKGVLERRKTIAPRLLDFEKAGDLTIVGDELADLSGIVGIVSRIKDARKLAAVAVDPAGLGELADELSIIKITAENGLLVGAPQGFGMMNAIKTAERKLTNGTLQHAKSAMMDWCVSNLKIEPTATAIRATKQNAGDAKIDPVMALFDAVIVMSTNPKVAGGSPYETRGVRTV
jgi:phage terminase large subunit-like protein